MTALSYLAQRLSAAIMAPLVIVHLIVMVLAIRNGLSAEEILGRTRGSLVWGAFYGLFVVAVSVHAAIGLRAIIGEWLPALRNMAPVIAWGIGTMLLILGLRAVYAVVI